MRSNLPVTGTEVQLDDERAIVSKTDLSGNITYVNPYFCEVSGFAEHELLGQPQNIVRHPDMPRAAFADLWATLRSGTPWTGMVKNRCKNGDFYWVQANVTPIRVRGKVTGYMSVRVRPSAEQVRAASEGYRMLGRPEGSAWTVSDGALVRRGWLFRCARLARLSLRKRIWLATSVVNLVLLALCAASFAGRQSGATEVAATVFGMLINLYLWHTLRSNVIAPLDQALAGARAIAAGDLSTTFEARSGDEMGQLLRALAQMNSNLIAALRDVRTNVDTMEQATREIAAGNADLSARTEAQAASLEETASSVEQFSATVKQNADSANQANGASAAAAAVAVSGGALVTAVVHTMDEINQSSRKIVDIIGLIDSIAFQTNILALNAAVEAARAGEQGRGFAVVAAEVRNLAQRSATAAKDIKLLINESLGKVDIGLDQVKQAGSTMGQVVASAQNVTRFMQDIASASQEQSLGVEQVNTAVAHMDQVTQQNAALVEQAAAAAASLAQQAMQLTQAVSVFQFGNRDAAAPAMPAAASARPLARPARGVAKPTALLGA